ncbi:MAG: hypothetical protein KY434_00100 [Actinobacteria bacterium]|nr:hypothetical protein [Actinomycetota bacterium]
MVTIKATCPTCGEVSLGPADIDLYVDRGNSDGSAYSFECPHCRAHVRKPADDRVIRLLVSGGVQARPETRPRAPERVADSVRQAPALTPDDLLDFHELISLDDWFQRLTDPGRDQGGG